MPGPPRTSTRRCPELMRPVLRQRADETAQEVRRGLLRGARVLVVLAGYPGEEVKTRYYERAHELGVEVVVLDHRADGVIGLDNLRARGIVVDVIPFDPVDDESARLHALDQVRQAGPLDGVVTFVEFGLPTAAWLAQVLGLPGNDYEAVRIGRDKERTRVRSEGCGVPAPRFHRICQEADLVPAAARVGFPAILKPVAGLTSIEVHQVRSPEDLFAQYRGTRRRMETAEHPNPGQLRAVTRGGYDMILEEYLDGREFDVDLLLSEGELVYGSVTDNQTHDRWPWVQVGANMPSALLRSGHDGEAELIAQAADWTRRLGYTEGAFHVEVKTRADGTPVLLEVNARLGGASQYDLNAAVWGVDLVEELLINSVGIPIRPQKPPAPRRWYAARYLLAPYSGTLESDTFLDAVALPADIDVLVCEPWVRAGERVNGPDPGPPDWLGELTVGALDLGTAESAVESAVAQVRYPIRADE